MERALGHESSPHTQSISSPTPKMSLKLFRLLFVTSVGLSQYQMQEIGQDKPLQALLALTVCENPSLHE